MRKLKQNQWIPKKRYKPVSPDGIFVTFVVYLFLFWMDKLLLSGGLSFIIVFFSIPVIIQVAKEKRLYDEPGERKIHKSVVPTLGGLGIFAGFMMAFLLFTPIHSYPELQFFIAACMIIFFLGLKDDILVLSATKKFAGQLMAAALLFKFGGVQLTSMHGFLGLQEMPYGIGMVVTILTIVMITNSFNLIDGVDGLAGGLGILTSMTFGIFFFLIGQSIHAIMAIALTGGLLAFLIYNAAPAKIFMGDTGSLLVGLINAILVIHFINISSISGTPNFIPSAPAIGFSVLMIPLFDTLRVFSLRILSRRSPFSPDRNHIHHFLLDLGFSHNKVTLIIILTNALFMGIAYLLKGMGTTQVLAVLVLLGLSFTSVVYFLRNKRLAQKTNDEKKSENENSSKVLKLVTDTMQAEQHFK